MSMKGFSSAYEDKGRAIDAVPRPGTEAYLRYVERRKREKDETEAAVEPVDNSPVGNLQPGMVRGTGMEGIPVEASGMVRGTGMVEGTGMNRGTGINSIPVQEQDGGLKLIKNYMRFDMDVFSILPELTEAEARIYLDFIRRTYGQLPPRNICSATRRMIGDTAGVASPNAQVKAIQGLERRQLVKRLITSRGKNELSMFRVYLPCELPGTRSTTAIRYESRNGSSDDTASEPVCLE